MLMRPKEEKRGQRRDEMRAIEKILQQEVKKRPEKDEKNEEKR